MHQFVESKFFTTSILVVILSNTLMLFLSTWSRIEMIYGFYFSVIDGIFMAIYMMECMLKIYVWRKYYFKQGWDLLGKLN